MIKDGILSKVVIAIFLVPPAGVFFGGMRKLLRRLRSDRGAFAEVFAGQAVIRERLLSRNRLLRWFVFGCFSLATRIHRTGSVIRSLGNFLRIVRDEGVNGIHERIISTAPSMAGKNNCDRPIQTYPLDFKRIRQPLHEVRVALKDAVNVVFDVGANTGQSAQNFQSSFPNANIYSFEPVASTFDELKNNCTGLDNINLFNIGFSDREREAEIFLAHESSWNSLESNIDNGIGKTTVCLTTIDKFCEQNQISEIDLLKIDTEGHELPVLNGAQNVLLDARIKSIFIEVGFYDQDKGHGNFYEINKFLQNFNFQIFSIGNINSAYIKDEQHPDYPWADVLFLHDDIVRGIYGDYYYNWIENYFSDTKS